jgi:acyl-CoA thioester hydrolase
MAKSGETPAPLPPLETWRGCANAWECDEMGHMNVRHYVAKCSEGLARIAAALSMPGAFGPKAASTLRPRSQHIRFLAEARAGAPLSMHGGVAAIGESDAQLYQELRHSDGRPAATFLTRVAHVDSRTGKPFPWPQRTHVQARAIACTVPAHGAPRSIDVDRPPPQASMARADALGAPTIGLGLVTPDMADAFGRMRAEHFVGKISDGAPNLFARWRKESGDAQGKQLGGAVLEYHLHYRRWPQVGDLIQVRSGVIELAEKTQRVIHWLLDPVEGEAWATGEVIAVTFDLDARKAVAPPPEQRAFLMAQAIPGLAE